MFVCVHWFYFFIYISTLFIHSFIRRRITCWKREIQERQRWTRYDIERTIGLLSSLVYKLMIVVVVVTRATEKCIFLHVFFFSSSFFLSNQNLYNLYVNLYVCNDNFSLLSLFVFLFPRSCTLTQVFLSSYVFII